jgi:hypothetical protein
MLSQSEAAKLSFCVKLASGGGFVAGTNHQKTELPFDRWPWLWPSMSHSQTQFPSLGAMKVISNISAFYAVKFICLCLWTEDILWSTDVNKALFYYKSQIHSSRQDVPKSQTPDYVRKTAPHSQKLEERPGLECLIRDMALVSQVDCLGSTYMPKLAATIVRHSGAPKGSCRKLPYNGNYHPTPKLLLINQTP